MIDLTNARKEYFLKQHRLCNSYGGFTHYRNYRALFLFIFIIRPHASHHISTIIITRSYYRLPLHIFFYKNHNLIRHFVSKSMDINDDVNKDILSIIITNNISLIILTSLNDISRGPTFWNLIVFLKKWFHFEMYSSLSPNYLFLFSTICQV